jgi:uncharacterized membrane protein
MTTLAAILATLALAAVTVWGDYFIKLASLQSNPLGSRSLLIACLINTAAVIGWVFIYRKLKLAAIGTLYSVCVMLLLALLGQLAFHEQLSLRERMGLVCGAASIILLARFGQD